MAFDQTGPLGMSFSPIPGEQTEEDLPQLLSRIFGGATGDAASLLRRLPALQIRGAVPDEIFRLLVSMQRPGGTQRPDLVSLLPTAPEIPAAPAPAPEPPVGAPTPDVQIGPPDLTAGPYPGTGEPEPSVPAPSAPAPSAPAPSAPAATEGGAGAPGAPLDYGLQPALGEPGNRYSDFEDFYGSQLPGESHPWGDENLGFGPGPASESAPESAPSGGGERNLDPYLEELINQGII